MQRVNEPFVDRDEAALLVVIGDWEEASRLELVEGAFMPLVSVSLVFRQRAMFKSPQMMSTSKLPELRFNAASIVLPSSKMPA